MNDAEEKKDSNHSYGGEKNGNKWRHMPIKPVCLHPSACSFIESVCLLCTLEWPSMPVTASLSALEQQHTVRGTQRCTRINKMKPPLRPHPTGTAGWLSVAVCWCLI